MRIALLADPHLSLLPTNERGRRFTDSRAIVRAAIDQINESKPDLACWLGDLTHEGTPAVLDAFAGELRRLTVPSLQIVGNHDVQVPTKARFARTIPVIRRGLFQWAGWVVAVLDPVQELSPEDHDGVFTDADLAMARDAVALAAGGPLLVLCHQPPREGHCTNHAAFFESAAEHAGVGVSIAGHTHANRHERRGRWHVIERASLILHPLQWHLLELTPEALRLEAIDAALPDAMRRQARAALLEHGGQAMAERFEGPPEARRLTIRAHDDLITT